MCVPRLEICGRSVEHRGPRQHVLVTVMDLTLEAGGARSSIQEETAGIWFGCLERLWLWGTGMGGRRPWEWWGFSVECA